MELSSMAKQESKESNRLESNLDSDINKIDKDQLNRPLVGDESKDATDRGEEFQPRQEWTEEQKQERQLESDWSDVMMDSIRSVEEYDIYKKSELQETEIGGRPCLIRDDIDMSQVDSMGRTNKERMSYGLAPLTKEGKSIELHHIGQKADSPLAELTMEEHRGKGNDTILHDKAIASEIDRNQFNMEKAEHWKSRAESIGGHR